MDRYPLATNDSESEYLVTKQALASRRHYLKNKEQRLADNRQRKKAVKAWYKDYKKQQSCAKCGESHWACLDFHHINPKSKVREIAVLVCSGWCIDSILSEIAKCEVLCANCHRKVTLGD